MALLAQLSQYFLFIDKLVNDMKNLKYPTFTRMFQQITEGRGVIGEQYRKIEEYIGSSSCAYYQDACRAFPELFAYPVFAI